MVWLPCWSFTYNRWMASHGQMKLLFFQQDHKGHFPLQAHYPCLCPLLWMPRATSSQTFSEGSVPLVSAPYFRCLIPWSWTQSNFSFLSDLRVEQCLWADSWSPLPGPTTTGCVTLGRWLTLSGHQCKLEIITALIFSKGLFWGWNELIKYTE